MVSLPATSPFLHLGPVLILGVGIDVISVTRVARALATYGQRFEERVFTAGERRDCAERVDRHQALAARFAAKEACLKALGTGWRDGFALRQVEVVRGEGGAPTLRLSGPTAEHAQSLGVRRLHVSLTHHEDIAAAAVVLES